MEFVVPNINLSVIISIVVGGFLLIQGVLQLITGKVFDKSYAKYTAASVKKFARPGGLCLTLMGLCLILEHFVIFGGNENSWMFMLGAVAVLAVILLIISAVTLKKK